MFCMPQLSLKHSCGSRKGRWIDKQEAAVHRGSWQHHSSESLCNTVTAEHEVSSKAGCTVGVNGQFVSQSESERIWKERVVKTTYCKTHCWSFRFSTGLKSCLEIGILLVWRFQSRTYTKKLQVNSNLYLIWKPN